VRFLALFFSEKAALFKFAQLIVFSYGWIVAAIAVMGA
jgi:hypothetical protein